MSPSSTLRDATAGNFRFLPGIPAFSSGAVAMPGYQIVHATVRAPVPWRAGFFEVIDRQLKAEGRPRNALCAIELRSPAQFTREGFDTFNAGYREVLAEWKILLDGENPIARTNVAPVAGGPAEPSLYAFSYTVLGETARPTFVAAGAGERRGDTTIRRGETSPDAMREKAAYVLSVMQERLTGLGGTWADVTMIDVYTAYPIDSFLGDVVLRPAGPAAIHGVRWFLARPPVIDLEYEMDVRGVLREVTVS